MTQKIRQKNFKEFWPIYMSMHQNKLNQKLHLLASLSVLSLSVYSFYTGQYGLLFALPILGYGPAWAGHFFIEKNRPASFDHPFYSLMADFKMAFLLLIGKLK